MSETRQLVPEDLATFLISLLVDLGFFWLSGPVRKNNNRIVRRHVSVHADRIEAPVGGIVWGCLEPR